MDWESNKESRLKVQIMAILETFGKVTHTRGKTNKMVYITDDYEKLVKELTKRLYERLK